MSRVAKKPIALTKGVELKSVDGNIEVKGPKGTLNIAKPSNVDVAVDNGQILLTPANDESIALTGTLRAILANMVTGVSEGFTRKLELVGVGYRAAVEGSNLNLSLGFSHPVVFTAPAGITITTPTQTEILISGADKQLIGEVAAKIRAYRKPEPYKGKGIRYAGEKIIMKEAKKA
ncbi:50S ribosomal protein L6 [Arenimonas sp.]|jgi:large subunit ribosomal protein L6|uniref:50S ribosomal protein L6 n=1 Tax=Arenimonas sp. TaxID=1872635 RepID=UPI0037BE40CD